MKKILKFQDLIDEKISLSHKVSPVFYYTSKDVKFRAVIRKEVGEKVVKDALLEWLKNGSKDLQGMAKVLQIASKDFGLSTIGENKHQYWIVSGITAGRIKNQSESVSQVFQFKDSSYFVRHEILHG